MCRLGAASRLIILLLIGVHITFCWIARERSLRGDVDLRAFYSAGLMVRQGHAARLYDIQEVTKTQHRLFGEKGRTLPFLYPAFAALPFVPLSWLSYTTVFSVVLFANLGILYASAFVLVRSRLIDLDSTLLLLGLFLCFFPATIALMQGQISCALLFVFLLAHASASQHRYFLAGLFLSLALAKFQVAVPVVLLFVLWRNWRLVCGFLTGGAGVLSVSLLMTGMSGAKAYVACLRGLGGSMLHDPASAQLHYGMQAAAEPNLHGLVLTLTGSGLLGTLLLMTGTLCVLAVAAGTKPTVASALPAAMLVSYHLQPYDLLLLLLPLALLLPSFMASAAQRLSLKVLIRASVLLLSTPLAPFLLVRGQTVWLVLAVCGIMAACTQTALRRSNHPGSCGRTRQ